jgi:hypothetical protein
MLGQLAVYSLNLVLIRSVVDPQGFTWHLDEDDNRLRSWDQLTHLWRSWLSIDSLAGLTAVISTTRTCDLIKLEATDTGTAVARSSRFLAIVDVSNTLADDITLGLAGLHAYDTEPDVNTDIDALQARMKWRGVDLDIAFALRAWWRNSELVDVKVLDRLFRTSGSVPPIAPGFLDVARRSILKSSNRSQLRHHFRPVAPWEFPKMSRELLDAYIELCAGCEPQWVDWLFQKMLFRDGLEPRLRQGARSSPDRELVLRTAYPSLGAFLEDSTFARPLLRVAVEHWNRICIRKFCAKLESSHPLLGSIELETAVLICRLAWRRSSLPLLNMSLQSLTGRLNIRSLTELRIEDASEILDILAAPLPDPVSVTQDLIKGQLRSDLEYTKPGRKPMPLEIPSTVAVRLVCVIGKPAEGILSRAIRFHPLDVDDALILAEYVRLRSAVTRKPFARTLREARGINWLPEYLTTERSRHELNESSRSTLEWLVGVMRGGLEDTHPGTGLSQGECGEDE